jgi:hypothetical protein
MEKTNMYKQKILVQSILTFLGNSVNIFYPIF